MTPKFYRITGWFLTASAVLGWLLCAAGIIFMWVSRPNWINQTVEMARLTDQTLMVTSDMLDVVQASLDQASVNLKTIQSTLKDVSTTISGTTPTMRWAGGIVGNDIAGVLASTQTSLTNLQSSARVVDDTLGFLARIPFSGVQYDPAAPLAAGVQHVADGLKGMPEALKGIEKSVGSAADNLEDVKAGLDAFTRDLAEIDGSIKEAGRVVISYKQIIKDLRAVVERIKQGLPEVITGLCILFTFLLVWAALNQAGLFLQGQERIERSRGYVFIRLADSVQPVIDSPPAYKELDPAETHPVPVERDIPEDS